MPSFNNIINNTDRVTIQTDDGDLNIDYYPARVTQQLIARSAELEKRANQGTEDATALFLETNEIFISMVEKWDMMDDKPCGSCAACNQGLKCTNPMVFMFELDANNLLRFSIEIMQGITQAIYNNSPNRQARRMKKS